VAETIIDRITDFLRGIGLEVRAAAIEHDCFLPGITIEHGTLVFDPDRMEHPGDLLHEAGHLAVMSPGRRAKAHVSAGKKAAEEMMAIAWSYAAAVHLGLDPAVVFHEGGYRGGSGSLIENFAQGRYIGVPMLQWLGMTLDGRRANEAGSAPYPAMTRWLYEG
jgi:hypothetical protein